MKEDLRALNEELDAANLRLRDKTRELEAMNNDLNNLAAELRAMAFRLIKSEEAERRAIARDLQDGVGQILAIAKLKLDALRAASSPPSQLKNVADIEKLIDQCNREIRSLAAQLCPAVLYDLGLVPALQWLADEMYSEHGLRCQIFEDAHPKPLNESVRVILFRAARELLMNVVKHARVKAAEVSIAVETNGSEDVPILKMIVRDNGKGFDPDSVLTSSYSGFGLLNVRERLSYIEGDVNIASVPGKGTAVTLTIPLR